MEHPVSLESTRALGETLSDFVHTSPLACDLKDPRTKRYVLTSWPFAEIVGLTREELIGKTAHELFFHKPALASAVNIAFLKRIKELDYQLMTQKIPVHAERNILMTSYGLLRVSNLVKAPILGHKAKVIGILTYSQEVTLRCDLAFLFRLYQQYYPEKKAIQYFLKHLNIDDYFGKLPTYREIMALLVMFSDDSHKHVAQLLDIQTSTAEVHIRNLREKVRNSSLREVLKLMRASSRDIYA